MTHILDPACAGTTYIEGLQPMEIMKIASRSFLPFVLAGALAACSDDLEPADPGGMGAGRPDRAGSNEVPAESVLRYSTPDTAPEAAGTVPGASATEPDTADGAA